MTPRVPQPPGVSGPLARRLRLWRRYAFALAAGGLGLGVVWGLFSGRQFFQSYLFAYVFWLGVSLGSLAALALYYMTGGKWGGLIRRPAEACARTLPMFAGLFLPFLLGLDDIYPWVGAHAEAGSHLASKARYLNVGAFWQRAALYFLVWLAIAWVLVKLGGRHERTGEDSQLRRLQRLSAICLALFTVAVSFAAIDWIMSLDPLWASSLFGAIIGVGFVLSGLAFTVLFVALTSAEAPVRARLSPVVSNDLGNLLFAFVMVWAYLSFSQFMLVWSANLAEEAPFYVRRLRSGWKLIATALLVFHFAFPFLLLLSRGLKRRITALAVVAVWILFMRMVDLFWLIAPSFEGRPRWTHLLDVILAVGLGGLWLGVFLSVFEKNPYPPERGPGLAPPGPEGAPAHG